jgi:hypothetical protein
MKQDKNVWMNDKVLFLYLHGAGKSGDEVWIFGPCVTLPQENGWFEKERPCQEEQNELLFGRNE